jgi:hypothetical protein
LAERPTKYLGGGSPETTFSNASSVLLMSAAVDCGWVAVRPSSVSGFGEGCEVLNDLGVFGVLMWRRFEGMTALGAEGWALSASVAASVAARLAARTAASGVGGGDAGVNSEGTMEAGYQLGMLQ